jgi:hypothetical protein
MPDEKICCASTPLPDLLKFYPNLKLYSDSQSPVPIAPVHRSLSIDMGSFRFVPLSLVSSAEDGRFIAFALWGAGAIVKEESVSLP